MQGTSTSYCAFDHKAWEAAGLKDFGDFADCVEYINQSEYGDDQLEGEWYWGDDEALVLYSGTHGNDHSPGSSHNTYAEAFDNQTDYQAALAEWEAQPEYLESADDEEDESDED